LTVLIAINLQTSFLTPPFGFSLFYLRSVAPEDITTGAIYLGVAPFIVLQAVAVMLIWLVPVVSTALPGFLYSKAGGVPFHVNPQRQIRADARPNPGQPAGYRLDEFTQ
jgi:hypothetical protein